MSSLRHRVMFCAFASLSLPAAGAAQASPAATSARTDAVLDVLRRIPAEHFSLYSTPLAEVRNGHGCAVIAPRLQGLCGTGWQQAFDPELSRRLAREVCAAYGLAAGADQQAPGVAARLDCFDARARIGLKLRGRVERRAVAGTDMGFPAVVDEPPDTDLDAAELAQLAAAGQRIHVADVETFFTAHSGDTFTTTLAYLASVCRFLDGVTDGEDVDLSACLAQRSMWIPVPEVRAPAGVAVEGKGNVRLEAERAATVVLTVDPKNAQARRSGRRARGAGHVRLVASVRARTAPHGGEARARRVGLDLRGRTALMTWLRRAG